MSFAITISFEDLAPEGQVTGAVVDRLQIEQDIEKDKIAGADVGELDDSSSDSAEEEIRSILAVEALVQEISNELADSERAIEITDGLNDVATIVDHVENPDLVHIALMQTAANMAVAGTDGDARDLLPSTESFRDGKLVVEQLHNNIKLAEESIADSLKGMAAKFGNLFKASFVRLQSLRKNIDFLKAEVSKLDNGHTKSFAVKNKDLYFNIDKNATGEDYVKGLTASNQFYSAYTTAFVGGVVNFEKHSKTSDELRRFNNPAKQAEVTQDLYKIFAVDFINSMKSLPATDYDLRTESRPGIEVFAKSPIISDRTLVFSVPKDLPATASGLEAQRIRSLVQEIQVRNFPNETKDVSKTNTTTFEVTKPYLLNLLVQAERLVKMGEQFNDKAYRSFERRVAAGGGYSEKYIPQPRTDLFISARSMNVALLCTAASEAMISSITRSVIKVIRRSL